MGNENYFKSGSNLNYTVFFENLDSADLPAQIVRVYDTLDVNKFDLSTFYFGNIQVADKNIIIPSGNQKYVVEEDLRPNMNLILRINMELDTTTGVIAWEFLSLDPVTRSLTNSVIDGFLPPNKVAPEGEGSVNYYVKTKDTLSSRTQILNKAAIYFDYNDPIITNEWKIVIDNEIPESEVKDLPTTVYDTSFTLNLAGYDEYGEIDYYNIYYASINDSIYNPWVLNSKDTIITFFGKPDSTYKFYSIAVDYAGNMEEPKEIYDTYTTIKQLLPPALVSPADSTFLVDVRPLFVWDSAQYSLKYQLQLSDTCDFSNLIIDNQNLIAQSYQDPDSLQYNKKYYWRMRSINGNFNSAWSQIFSFTTIEEPAIVPDTWAFTNSTGVSSNIVIPSAIFPKVGNRYFAKGDAVGLFFTRNDSLICAGYGVWNSQDLTITVWGDNPETQVKDGFATNEVYYYKVWDAQETKERKGFVEYESGNNFFTNASNSILKKLFTNETQSIIVKQGWNYISSYIIPENPALENVFADYSENLLILKTIKGQTFIPQYEINTIGNWNNLEAYQGYFTQADTINLSGETIIPENTPIILTTGWSLVPYLRNISGGVEDNLNSIVENDGGLLIAKTISGSVYIPSYGINTIGSLKPGEGYQMYLSRKDTLIYPANSFGKTTSRIISPNPIYLEPRYTSTGSSSTLIILTNAKDNDEIGIYNQKDELIGSGIVHEGIAALTIWGDNERTKEIDGAEINYKLKIMNYELNTGKMQEVQINDLVDFIKGEKLTDIYYSKDAFIVARAKVVDNNSNLSMLVNPNPASDYIEITIDGDSDNTSLILFSNEGKQIADITTELLTMSGNKIRYNTTNLSSGNYNLILNNGTDKIMKQILIVK